MIYGLNDGSRQTHALPIQDMQLIEILFLWEIDLIPFQGLFLFGNLLLFYVCISNTFSFLKSK